MFDKNTWKMALRHASPRPRMKVGRVVSPDTTDTESSSESDKEPAAKPPSETEKEKSKGSRSHRSIARLDYSGDLFHTAPSIPIHRRPSPDSDDEDKESRSKSYTPRKRPVSDNEHDAIPSTSAPSPAQGCTRFGSFWSP